MALRFQMKINWGEVAGWTEEFYTNSTLPPSDPTSQAAALLMAQSRAGCLTRNARVAAVIVTDPFNPRLSRAYAANYQGLLGASTLPAGGADAPFVAVQINLYTDGSSKRQYLMRGLPDGDVVGGIITFASSGEAPYTLWRSLITGGSAGIGLWNYDAGLPTTVNTVSGSGLMTILNDGPAPSRGNFVYVSARVVGNGARIRQIARVQSVVTATTMQLRPWTNGNCDGNFVRVVDYGYKDITSADYLVPNRAKYRKTGKPFGLYRGKASPHHGG